MIYEITTEKEPTVEVTEYTHVGGGKFIGQQNATSVNKKVMLDD